MIIKVVITAVTQFQIDAICSSVVTDCNNPLSQSAPVWSSRPFLLSLHLVRNFYAKGTHKSQWTSSVRNTEGVPRRERRPFPVGRRNALRRDKRGCFPSGTHETPHIYYGNSCHTSWRAREADKVPRRRREKVTDVFGSPGNGIAAEKKWLWMIMMKFTRSFCEGPDTKLIKESKQMASV